MSRTEELCKQCTIELYGTHSSDFTGLVTEQQFYSGLVAKADCTGCGTIYVNHEGSCQSKCCEKRHGDY